MICTEKQWWELNTLHAGMGKVQVFVLDRADELPEVVGLMRQNGKSVIVCGAGTNAIGCDSDDERVAVVKLPAKLNVVVDGVYARCSAGALGTRIFCELATHGLGGASAISGIPGTLGGMLKMNAGANGLEIERFVVEVHGYSLTTGAEWNYVRNRADDGGWGYRTSPVPEDVCVTSALLKMEPGNSDEELAKIRSELERRRRVTPSWWSAGSIFRNPSAEMSAGKILENCGCKGMKRGAFCVSEKHANWIVNYMRKPGMAEDVLGLIADMKAKSPIPLRTEVKSF